MTGLGSAVLQWPTLEGVPMKRALSVIAAVCLLLSPRIADATWSVVIVDAHTKEVAIGSVTCLTTFDLLAITPVILVGVGGATVQAAGDFDGVRRPIIYDEFLAGTDPQDILDILSGVTGHQQRQYGIVDTLGRGVTFTGGSTFSWAGGVIGTDGDLVYALQGNILAGNCVVPAMEAAILASTGDVPAKLMEAMEAARAAGGDGRCSCSQAAPTSCGCPPGAFAKSGHIGYMLTARIGDVDDPNCNASGCADGNYFMNFNVPFQGVNDPDPVLQMQTQFDAWRNVHLGRVDAVQSTVGLDPMATATSMTIRLNDWQRETIVFDATLEITHEADSDGISVIGDPIEVSQGIFEVLLEAGPGVGTDRLRITATDPLIGEVILMPSPEICIGDVAGGLSADCNLNGLADECEIAMGLVPDSNDNGIPDACEMFQRGDCDADGAPLGLADAVFELDYLFGPVDAVTCEKACDLDDDGILGLADPLTLLGVVFLGYDPPPPPFGACGFDPTDDPLSCESFPPCL